MNFWVKNSILAILLSVLAYYLLSNYEWLLEYIGDSSSPASAEYTTDAQDKGVESEIAKAKPLEQSRETKNKAAEGLSSFYASLNPDMKNGPIIRENVVYLSQPAGNINHVLEDRIKTVKGISSNWRGRVEPRRFSKGDTLYKKLNDYAEEAGVGLLWWLDKDFIIKSPFRVNKSVIQTAYVVGKSISGHYPEGVNTYFCNRHRTIVITTNPTHYVIENCQLVRSNTSDYEY